MSHPDTIFELLAGHNIRMRSVQPGRGEHVVCPKCGGGSKREPSLSVKIDDDNRGATWVCHRGNCNWTGGERLKSPGGGGFRPSRPPPPPPPTKPVEDANKDRPKWLYEYFAGRGIGDETVDAFGLYAAKRWFHPPIGEQPAMVFPYRFKRELVNRKFRSMPPNKAHAQDQNVLPTLFNIDSVEGVDEVIWVEGEIDVLSLHEAGYRQVVSLKDGAPGKLRAEDDPARENDKRYAALATHADLLGEVARFILAGDMDDPGMVLREELARRLGRHRCWTVDWPEGCKDANDTLRQRGPEGVRAAINAAQPYPIEGLQTIRPGTLTALRHRPPPMVLTTGSRATDEVIKLPGDGRLIVVTGMPNGGKSSWLIFVSVHLMAHHNRRFVVFSPEMQPWEHYVAQCASVWHGRPFWPQPADSGLASLSDEEIVAAEMWLSRRMTMIVSDAEAQAPTLDWIMDKARMAILQQGCTDLIIDPWNEIEQDRKGSTETEYVGRSLQRLRSFANRHGCNVWIIAHPTKLRPPNPGEKIPAPGLYDVSGGANWANKADMGLCVHRTEFNTEIHMLKSRFFRWGTKGSTAKLDFEPRTGRYSTPRTLAEQTASAMRDAVFDEPE